ncbi:uncharacterized [Tachysurus ichikawai]
MWLAYQSIAEHHENRETRDWPEVGQWWGSGGPVVGLWLGNSEAVVGLWLGSGGQWLGSGGAVVGQWSACV